MMTVMTTPQERHRDGGARSGSWLTLALTIFSTALAIAAISVWYHYLGVALADTLSIAALLSISPPGLFAAIKTLSIATLAVCVVLMAAIAALAMWRSLLMRSGGAGQMDADAGSAGKYTMDTVAVPPLAAAPARQRATHRVLATAVACVLWLVVLWLVVVIAMTVLWTGGGFILARASNDGVSTLSDVDPAVSELIQRASGGAIDTMAADASGTYAPEPFILEVGPPDAKREVDIGNTTCGLMCFVLARTLMSDQLDCTCSPAILAQIHVIAQNGWKHHLAPASAGILITYGAGSVLLAMLAAQLGYLSGVMEAVRGMWRGGANGIMVVDGTAAGLGPHGNGRAGKGGVPLGEGRVRSVEQVQASLQMV